MSNTNQHTPGPWRARKGISYPAVVETNDCQEFIYIAEKKNAIENAHLIATAPLLLGLAIYIRGCLTETGECVIKLGQPMDKLITEIIAKARGES